jgi:hypothetical protein
VETGRPSDPTLAANFIQHGSYINLMYGDRPETYGYPYRFDPRNEEIAGSLAKVTDALAQRFRHEPARYLSWYLVGKPLVYLSWDLTESVGDAFIFAPLASPYQDDGLFRLTHDLARSTHPVLMLLAVIGIAVGFLQSRALALLFALVLAYFLLLHMVGAPFPRYSVPVRPLCYGLAMLTLQQALARLRNRGVRR